MLSSFLTFFIMVCVVWEVWEVCAVWVQFGMIGIEMHIILKEILDLELLKVLKSKLNRTQTCL